MLTYQDAEERLLRPRPKDSKIIDRNTVLHRAGDNIVIRFHNTDVVTISPQNIYTLNNGGWQTITTKERINRYAPVNIWQRDFEWYVNTLEGQVDFYNGMQVDERGSQIVPVRQAWMHRATA